MIKPIYKQTFNPIPSPQSPAIICGVSGEVAGFSFVETGGKNSGIDLDICRAIAKGKS